MSPDLVFALIALPLGFGLAVVLTFVFMKIGLRKGILDVPNNRSSHTSPVPRGGGLSVVILFLVFICLYPGTVGVQSSESAWLGLLVGGAIVAGVGAADDVGHIPAQWRIVAHALAAAAALSLLPSLPGIPLYEFAWSMGGLTYVIFAVLLVWLINLFNFMDGIDGIAAIETITVLAGSVLIMFAQDQTAWVTLLSFLAVCAAGFLIWNWPPASVFMGDACSGFLGFTLGFLMLATSLDGALNVWVWLILMGVFLVDSTVTLVTRVLRRERWYEAHRSHAYQILARRLDSHRAVSVGVLLVNLIWLLPLGYLAARYPHWAGLIFGVAMLPLLLLAIRIGAGTPAAESTGEP